MHLIKVSVDFEHRSLLVGVVATLSERTVLFPREAPTVLSLVLFAQYVHSLLDIKLIVRLALRLPMCPPTVRGFLTRSLLFVLRAEYVWLDLDVRLLVLNHLRPNWGKPVAIVRLKEVLRRHGLRSIGVRLGVWLRH